mgnify:CR=1 FL=1
MEVITYSGIYFEKDTVIIVGKIKSPEPTIKNLFDNNFFGNAVAKNALFLEN